MIICADDYAQSFAVSQAISELIKNEAVSATSCMVTSPDSARSLRLLPALAEQADIGLHFVLSEGRPMTALSEASYLVDEQGRFLPFGLLLRRLYLREVDESALEKEMRTQLQKFRDETGVLPDFFDGHQHVHQLPRVRGIFAALAAQVQKEKKVYARVSRLPIRATSLRTSLGGWLISWPSRALEDELKRERVPHTGPLWGYHDYSQPAALSRAFEICLQADPGRNDVFFFHPGFASGSGEDPLAEVRPANFNFANSADFKARLCQNKVPINRFHFE